MLRARQWLSVFVFALANAVAFRARAQASVEPSTIDAVRGTIKGSTRYIGLAGAFVAIADDTEGVAINPASVAVRLPYSWDDISFAFGIDFSVAAWLPKNKLYNEPEGDQASKSKSLFGSVAVLTNYRHVGFGVAAEAEQNAVSRKAQGVSTKLTANFGLMHTNVAYGYFGGQLQLGAGLRIVGTSFDASQFDGVKNVGLATAGVGYAAGLIIKPIGAPFRLGGAIEQPINAELEGDAHSAPVTLHVPWTTTMGLAYQFGARKLNPRFVTVAERARKIAGGRHPTAEDERRAAKELYDEYEKDQTWYLLVTSELALIEGGGEIALGKFTAIDRPLYSPRIGFESEVVPRWLRGRTGSYLELPATEEGSARLHGTIGFDVKTFEWDVFGLIHPFDYWQLSLAADVAKSYLNTSFSIGFWH